MSMTGGDKWTFGEVDWWNYAFWIIFTFLACGILVPWPGIEPMPSELGSPSCNHPTTREAPALLLSDGRAASEHPAGTSLSRLPPCPCPADSAGNHAMLGWCRHLASVRATVCCAPLGFWGSGLPRSWVRRPRSPGAAAWPGGRSLTPVFLWLGAASALPCVWRLLSGLSLWHPLSVALLPSFFFCSNSWWIFWNSSNKKIETHSPWKGFLMICFGKIGECHAF